MLMYTHICMYIHTYNGKNMDYIYIHNIYIYTHIEEKPLSHYAIQFLYHYATIYSP